MLIWTSSMACHETVKFVSICFAERLVPSKVLCRSWMIWIFLTIRDYELKQNKSDESWKGGRPDDQCFHPLCSQPFFQILLHIETCNNIQVVLYLYVSLPNGLVRFSIKFYPIPSFSFFKSRCLTFINQILDPGLYLKSFTF